MEKLEAWLEAQGLNHYFELFKENDPDLKILSDLSGSHLESLGISLGHRLKFDGFASRYMGDGIKRSS